MEAGCPNPEPVTVSVSPSPTPLYGVTLVMCAGVSTSTQIPFEQALRVPTPT